ncbi:MAG: hypothetical protein JXA28_13950 [Bacteroidetes bacterium]|nr:hypothetical protein [Bacteroidota bacterium]
MKTLIRSKQRQFVLTMLSALILLCTDGCSTLDQVTVQGETVSMLVGPVEIEAELLLLTDSAAYIIPHIARPPIQGIEPGKIYRADHSVFPQFTVEGLVNTDWVPWLLGMQVIPAILVGIEAAAYSDANSFPAVTGIMLIPTALNALFFLGGSAAADIPPFHRNDPKTPVKDYIRYAHFPQGLTPEQLQLLLQAHGQTEPLSLADAAKRVTVVK